MRICLSTAEVAAKLGKTRAWFYKHRQDLTQNHGFPAPIAATGCYDELAVDLWIDKQAGLAQSVEASNAREQLTADDRIMKRLAALSRERPETNVISLVRQA